MLIIVSVLNPPVQEVQTWILSVIKVLGKGEYEGVWLSAQKAAVHLQTCRSKSCCSNRMKSSDLVSSCCTGPGVVQRVHHQRHADLLRTNPWINVEGDPGPDGLPHRLLGSTSEVQPGPKPQVKPHVASVTFEACVCFYFCIINLRLKLLKERLTLISRKTRGAGWNPE